MGDTQQVTISDYTEQAMTAYGKEVLLNRAVPDYRDGLKPIQRKIIYDMSVKNYWHLTKSARIVGEVIGALSPHGDKSTFDALVGLTQRHAEFPFVYGEGNWGGYFDQAGAMRYCFVAGTRIMTELGLVCVEKIPELLGINVPLNKQLDLDVELKVQSDEKVELATSWVNSGKHRTVIIKTKKGFKNECTPNQPFLVLNRDLDYVWKPVTDLKVGDKICLKRGSTIFPKAKQRLYYELRESTNIVNTIDFPKHMSIDLASILGHLVADGFVRYNCVYFGSSYQSVIDDFIKSFEKVFPGLPYSWEVESPHSYGKRDHARFVCNSVHLVDFFKGLGLFEGNSYNRIIPEIMFSSSKEEMAAFLRSYFEGDGSISTTSESIHISVNSVSTKLLRQVKLVLLNYFGIISNELYHDKDNCFKFYIMSNTNLVKFKEEIGFISNKKIKALKSIKDYYNGQNGSLTDTIHAVKNYIKEFFSARKLSNVSYLDEQDCKVDCRVIANFGKLTHLPNDYKGSKLKLEEVDMKGLKNHFPTLAQKLEDFYARDYFYDEITEIKQTNKKKYVYDLTVPTSHAFIANGFVSHNTDCKLHKNARHLLEYMPIAEMMPNYDGKWTEPVVLPSKIPNLLMAGTYGIAVGWATSIPPHAPSKALKTVIAYMHGEQRLIKLCKILGNPKYLHGGLVVSSPNETLKMYSEGKGTLYFQGDFSRERVKNSLAFQLSGVPPMNFAFETFVKNLSSKKWVSKIITRAKSKDGSSSFGLIILKRDYDYREVEADFKKAVTKHTSYDWNVTITAKEILDCQFMHVSLIKYLDMWCKYRINLENTWLSYNINKLKKDRHRLNIQVIIHENADKIPKILWANDAKKAVEKYLDIHEAEDIDYVLGLRLQSIAKKNVNEIRERINKLKKEIKELKEKQGNLDEHTVSEMEKSLSLIKD